MKFKLPVVYLFCATIVTFQSSARATTFIPIDYPGASQTYANSIEGTTVVGTYYIGGETTPSHGFFFDGSTYTTFDHPLAVGGTRLTGLSGSLLVGSYFDSANVRHGFLWDGVAYTPIDVPSSAPGTTRPLAIDGNTIVGAYVDGSNNTHGFVFDGSTYTTVTSPFSPTQTLLLGVSGSNIVGGSGFLGGGFLYDGTTFTPIGPPDSLATMIFEGGIDGSTIVGDFYNPLLDSQIHGFFYNGSTYSTLQNPSPLAANTTLSDASENRLVGYYYIGDFFGSEVRGFMAIIPEPSTFVSAILGMGLLMATMGRNRWGQRRR
jgi:hypothetical protein